MAIATVVVPKVALVVIWGFIHSLSKLKDGGFRNTRVAVHLWVHHYTLLCQDKKQCQMIYILNCKSLDSVVTAKWKAYEAYLTRLWQPLRCQSRITQCAKQRNDIRWMSSDDNKSCFLFSNFLRPMHVSTKPPRWKSSSIILPGKFCCS